MDKPVLRKLDNIIRKYKGEGRGIVYAHGLVASLLSSPEKIHFIAVKDVVLSDDGDTTDFLASDEYDEFLPNFSNFYCEISQQLEAGTFTPLLSFKNKKADSVEDEQSWCRGYLEGMSIYRPLDEAKEDKNLYELLLPILSIAHPELLIKAFEKIGLKDSQKESFEEQSLGEALEELPAVVTRLFENNRPEDAKRDEPQPIVSGPKVGRNDPCPCNSGKKYKKCCGR